MFAELAQEIIPSQSPYWAAQDRGDGQVTAGNGDGSGVYDFSGVGGPLGEAPSGENGMGRGPSVPEVESWLASQGYKLMEAPQPGRKVARWLVDQNGQMIGEPQVSSTDDRAAFYAGLLGLGVAGAAFAGAGGAAGAAGGGVEAGAAGAAGGTAGSAGAAGAAGDGLLMSAGEAGAFGGWGTAGSADLAAQVAGTGAAGGAAGGAAAGGTASGGGILGSLGSMGGSGTGWGTALQLGGAALNQYNTGKVLDAQTQATRESNNILQGMYDTQRADLAPYREAGTSALSQIQALLKDPSSLSTQGDYKFGLDQGIKARENSAGARGMAFSGAQQKALTRYGQDYAGTKLNESYNRLSNLAGLGQVGATGSAQAAGQLGQSLSGNALGMGNAKGSAYVGAANGWTNAFGNIANQQQNNQLMELLRQQNGG